MKILAFVDVHANVQVLEELSKRARDADLLVCAGDLSVFGDGLEETVAAIDAIGKPCLMIHGNHEDEDDLEVLVRASKNIKWLHRQEIEIAGLSFVGWGGGGFARRDPELAAFAATVEPHPSRIWVFHGPPFGTAIDVSQWSGGHTGCHTRRAVIEEQQPLLALAGHMHECFEEQDLVGDTIVLNPGPLGTLIELRAEETK